MENYDDDSNHPVILAWPNCASADCHHKACASKNSIYCGPCTLRMNSENSAPAGYFDEFREAQRKDGCDF